MELSLLTQAPIPNWDTTISLLHLQRILAMDFVIRKRRRRSALDPSLSLYDNPRSADDFNEVDQARVALNAELHPYDLESPSAARPALDSNSALSLDSQRCKSAKISGTNEQPALSIDAFLKRSAPHFILKTYARSRRRKGHMKSSLPSPLHPHRRQRLGCAYLQNSGKPKSQSARRNDEEAQLDGLLLQRIGSPLPLRFATRLSTSAHSPSKSKHRQFVRSKASVATAQFSSDHALQPSDGNIPKHPLTSWKDSYVVSSADFSKIGKVQSPTTYRSGQPLTFCAWNVHDEHRKFRFEDTRPERQAKIVQRINRALPIEEFPPPRRSPPNVNLVKFTTASDHTDDVLVTLPVPLDDQEYRSNIDQTPSNAHNLVHPFTASDPPEQCAPDITCPQEHSESLTAPQSNITESTDTRRPLRSLSTFLGSFLSTARAVHATQDVTCLGNSTARNRNTGSCGLLYRPNLHSVAVSPRSDDTSRPFSPRPARSLVQSLKPSAFQSTNEVLNRNASIIPLTIASKPDQMQLSSSEPSEPFNMEEHSAYVDNHVELPPAQFQLLSTAVVHFSELHS